jgi:hypothetical protein
MTWAMGRRVNGMRTCALARPTAARGTMMRRRQRINACVLVGAVPRSECDVAGRIKMGKVGRQPPVPGQNSDKQSACFVMMP